MSAYNIKLDNITQLLAVMLVIFLIISTAMVSVLVFLVLTSYVLSGNYASKWQTIWASPVARVSLLLFGLFVLGALYSTVGFSEIRGTLNSYRELWLVPIVMSVFTQEKWRQRAYYSFLAVIVVAILLSFSLRMGLMPQGKPEEEWVPFKGRIAYGFFLSFAIYLMIHGMVLAKTLKLRFFWMVFAGLGVINLFFLTTGRTGYVVFLALMALLLVQYRVQVKKYWLLILIAVPLLMTLTVVTSTTIKSRFGDIEKAYSDPEASDIGRRLIFWKTSLRIIADNPLFGTGTGSFTHESLSYEVEHPNWSSNNPHNEYLLIASQLGIVGLAVFIWLLYLMFRVAMNLPQPYSLAAQGLVVAMAVGCLFNSFLRDQAEGHFFAVFAGLLFSSAIPARDKLQIAA
jgi:O-antigen ligase